MINNIAKVTIYVSKQEAAKDFWTDKMGFICEERPMGPKFTWMEVKPNESAVTTFVMYEKDLMKMQNPNANVEHPNIILSTTNIELSHETMKQRGVEVADIQNMPYGKMFSFKDQDGNQYLLREDV